MVEMDAYPHGVPAWVDLGARDIPAAVAFYGGLFGWDHEPGRPEFGGYGTFRKQGRLVAGIGPAQDPGAPVMWSIYLSVDDCDAAVAAASEQGGRVVAAPMDIPGSGRMAYLADPQGAFFGVWQSGGHRGAEVMDEPGTPTWHELQTSDVDAAVAFYGDTFGWSFDDVNTGMGVPYTVARVGDNGIAGLLHLPQEGIPPHWEVTFAVADPDETATRATELGGQVLAPPRDLPTVGRFAVLQDPEGALFGVLDDTVDAA